MVKGFKNSRQLQIMKSLPARPRRGRKQNKTPKPMDFSFSNEKHGQVARALPLYPVRTLKTIPYFDNIAFTGTASAANAYVLSANGVFDPDITGTGHQPMGFDQMMLFYNHYTVIRSRLILTATNVTVTAPVFVAIHISGSSTVVTNFGTLVEAGALVYTSLLQVGVDGSQATVRAKVDAGAFQGIVDIMDDPDMRGDAASNPAEQIYFHMTAFNATSATVPVVQLSFRVEYDVMFHEPRTGTAS